MESIFKLGPRSASKLLRQKPEDIPLFLDFLIDQLEKANLPIELFQLFLDHICCGEDPKEALEKIQANSHGKFFVFNQLYYHF